MRSRSSIARSAPKDPAGRAVCSGAFGRTPERGDLLGGLITMASAAMVRAGGDELAVTKHPLPTR